MTVKERLATDILKLNEDFERVVNHVFRHQQERVGGDASPIENWIDSERREFHLRMPVPGMQAEVLNVILQGKYVVVTAKQKETEGKSIKSFLEREFSYDQFERAITLPDGVDATKMTAEFKDGFLNLSGPIDAAALPKTTPIKNGTPADEDSK